MTEQYSGAFVGGLGCFPLDNGTYLPLSISVGIGIGIQSLRDVSTPVGALGHVVLYLPCVHSPGLTLKLFRGEPAITKLD